MSKTTERKTERKVRANLVEETKRRIVEQSSLTLTPELLEKLVELVEAGHWPEIAARSLGVPPQRMRGWLERGEEQFMRGEPSSADPSGLQAELFLRVSEAEARCEIQLVDGMRGRIAENKYFQGFLAQLARRFPERWGERRELYTQEQTWEDRLKQLDRMVAHDRSSD